MTVKDNYQIQLMQAKKLFLTYDQQELIRRCRLRFDEIYLYTSLLSEPYRIHRQTADVERLCAGSWVSGNSFGEVMTLLDWLCDSHPNRYITGRWINMVTHGHSFHRSLQEEGADPDAQWFEKNPDALCAACEALHGKKQPGADISYAIELFDGLEILLQLWHGDEEFPPRLRFLWDENTTRYIRYETTWYAIGLLIKRIKECMERTKPTL